MVDTGSGSEGDRSVCYAAHILVREVDTKRINKKVGKIILDFKCHVGNKRGSGVRVTGRCFVLWKDGQDRTRGGDILS